MTSKRLFSVAETGFSEHDHQVLKSILWLSKIRPISYSLTRFSPRALTDIVIINGDDTDALATWTAYRKRNPLTPAVMVRQEQPMESRGYYIRRPLVAPRVLNMLDSVADKEGLISASRGLDEAMVEPTKALQSTSSMALVVDDSLAARQQIGLELKELGIKVDFAESAERAYEHLERNVYGIIVLDVLLPDGDGLRLCKGIKKDERTKQTPVIILTGKSSPLDRLKGKIAGCEAYLIKPVHGDTLRRAIQQYLPSDSGYQVAGKTAAV